MTVLPDGASRGDDAATFRDPGVAAAYTRRPPYPESLIVSLSKLVAGGPRIVLDLGCGSGDIARPLSRYVTEVHAVDPSTALIDIGRALHAADAGRIRWFEATAETFDFAAEYGLVVAGESFHWMRWKVVVPKVGAALHPDGYLALVGRIEKSAWQEEMAAIIPRYSMIKNFVALDVASELERAGLVHLVRRSVTPFEPFRQSVEDYIEMQHSRAAFARYRMAPEQAGAFDGGLRSILARYATDGDITYEAGASLDVLRPAR